MVQCGTMFHDGVFVSVGKCGRNRALGYLKIDGVNECPSNFSLTARSSQQTSLDFGHRPTDAGMDQID